MPIPDKTLWQSISPLLDQVLDLDVERRAAFITALAATRPDLASTLTDLLAQHQHLVASGYLESPPIGDDLDLSLAGRQVGPYTLEAPLGMGGMGAVWKASRSDGRYEGAVAIKLLNISMLDAQGLERFRREGSILARLSHPNIARLLDAGVWMTGQPYLVIEYVQGEAIDRACDAGQLDVDARLTLFLQVADAVAHAHVRLVVHRDLKPTNILVTRDGRVKLLDFGIASLLEEANAVVATTGSHALTPQFAAPEQVEGEPVSTATDVYALGVLLYRLLAGRHPTGEGCTTPAQFARALAEVRPMPASVAIGVDGDDVGAQRGMQRATTARALAARLRGDLETILDKALEKQPARRYASVAAMADDLRRHLAHEPVLARPASRRYRVGRFLRRHRGAAAAATFFLVALVATTIAMARQAAETRRQRDAAVQSQRQAEATSEFMSFLVSQIGDQPMTMRQVLDRSRLALEEQYRDDPATVARMLTQLSGRFMELHDAAAVRATLSRALEIATRAHVPELIAAITCDLAEWHADQGDVASARQVFARAQAALGAIERPPVGLRVECLLTEQAILAADSQAAAAVVPARAAVALLEAEGNTMSTRFTSALNTLAMSLDDAGLHLEALGAQRRVIDVLDRIGRGRTTAMAVGLHNLAYTQADLGRWREAAETYARAVEIVEGFDGAGTVPAVYAVTQGRMLLLMGRDDDAASWLARGMSMVTEPASPLRQRALVGQLELALRRRDVEEARVLVGHLLPMMADASALVTRDVALLRARLAVLERDAEAARRHIDTLLRAQGYGTASPAGDLYQVLGPAAAVVLEAGDAPRAAALAREAAVLAERACGSGEASAHVGVANLVLARALAQANRRDDAARHAALAADLLARAAGAGHPLAEAARAFAR